MQIFNQQVFNNIVFLQICLHQQLFNDIVFLQICGSNMLFYSNQSVFILVQN
jgi:hypothetical protein